MCVATTENRFGKGFCGSGKLATSLTSRAPPPLNPPSCFNVGAPPLASHLICLSPLNTVMIRAASGDASLSFNTLWIINMCTHTRTHNTHTQHTAEKISGRHSQRDPGGEGKLILCQLQSFQLRRQQSFSTGTQCRARCWKTRREQLTPSEFLKERRSR